MPSLHTCGASPQMEGSSIFASRKPTLLAVPFNTGKWLKATPTSDVISRGRRRSSSFASQEDGSEGWPSSTSLAHDRIVSRTAASCSASAPDVEGPKQPRDVGVLRPADAQAVFDRKLAAFRGSGARTLVTANLGCQIQWEN